MSLITFARDYRELYAYVGSRLHPRSALVLTYTCRELHMRAHDHAQWYARIAPTLTAIVRIKYHIVRAVYSMGFSRNSITRMVSVESARVCGGRVTVAYTWNESVTASWRTAGDHTRIINTHTDSVSSIVTHGNVTSVNVRSSIINRVWKIFYMWTAQQIRACDILCVGAFREDLCDRLSPRDCRALACTCRELFNGVMSQFGCRVGRN